MENKEINLNETINNKQNKKKNKGKFLVLAGISALTIIGGTLAYFTTSDEIANYFSTAKYEAQIIEQFESPDKWQPGTTTSKTIVAKNNGNIDMAVRASYTEKWVSKNGTELELKDSNNNDVAIINFNSGWTKADDGYYYYGSKSNLTKLESGQTSTSFISGVTFNPNTQATLSKSTSADGKTITYSTSGNGYDGAKYTLTLKVETIQYDQATNAWN